MVWFILGFIGFIVALIFIVRDEYSDLGEKICISMIGLMLSTVLSLLVFLISSVIVSCCAKIDYDVVSDTKIVA